MFEEIGNIFSTALQEIGMSGWTVALVIIVVYLVIRCAVRSGIEDAFDNIVDNVLNAIDLAKQEREGNLEEIPEGKEQ